MNVKEDGNRRYKLQVTCKFKMQNVSSLLNEAKYSEVASKWEKKVLVETWLQEDLKSRRMKSKIDF